MIIGTTLLKGVTGYTPWFPREGNAATFVFDIIGISDDASVTVSIMHKDYENDDSAEALVVAFAGVNKRGVYTERGSGVKQLLRCEVAVSGAYNYDWIHFRMLRPSWERNGATGGATGATPVGVV